MLDFGRLVCWHPNTIITSSSSYDDDSIMVNITIIKTIKPSELGEFIEEIKEERAIYIGNDRVSFILK